MHKIVKLIIAIVIGIVIILSPSLITGRGYYEESHIMGELLIAEFVVRTFALIIGLLTIYSGVREYSK